MAYCGKCFNLDVCKTTDSCDGHVPGCKHFKDKSKIMELPCLPGDAVWLIAYFPDEGKINARQLCVVDVCANVGMDVVVSLSSDPIESSECEGVVREKRITAKIYGGEFGKTAFLSRKAAEKALAEMRGNDG